MQPSWTLYIQVMTFEQAEKFGWNPFDLTKVRVHFLFNLVSVDLCLLVLATVSLTEVFTLTVLACLCSC